MLANNAGALFASRRLTSEGLEQTFALNHLAPFLLTNLLRDRLAGGRVVTTASDAHRLERVGERADELATMLEVRGVTHLASYTQRQRQMIPLRAQ